MRLVLGTAAILVAALGCTHTGALKETAARELGCSEDQVIILTGGTTRKVEACGKEAIYHWNGSIWVQR
jgi:hypothetical protein